MVREPIKYLILLICLTRARWLRTFGRKAKCSYGNSTAQTKKVEKYKKPVCRAVFRALSNIYDGAFLRKYNG